MPMSRPHAGSTMSQVSRFAFIDLMRVLAAQMIVIHHLAFYGPLSDHAYPLAPATIDWLYEYGRLAVQIFFVSSGYLMAGSLGRRSPDSPRAFVAVVVERYARLGLPYLVALGVALGANELARAFVDHDSISPRPTLGQLVAHLFLLHLVAGYDSLTAGIWYVAIDLQLVALANFVYLLARRLSPGRNQTIARYGMLVLGLVSAFLWNHSPDLDRFGIYFLSSYVLGMAAAWTSEGSLPKKVFLGYLAAIGLALLVDFRSRLALAAVVAIVLVLAHGRAGLAKLASARIFQRLAPVTYSLFLIHFPICLVVNALWSTHLPQHPWLAMLGMVVAFILSQAGGFAFYYLVERRLAHVRLPGMAPKKALAS
jgi:peptidoglycan/LPS O-acetylase OafA/YrhL